MRLILAARRGAGDSPLGACAVTATKGDGLGYVGYWRHTFCSAHIAVEFNFRAA
jgi:hypothetical protein